LLQTLAAANGLRPATAGEFTRRAVLNDKMNVLQAEALDCLIRSQTESQRNHALNALKDDRIRAKYVEWSDKLLRFVAYMEAYVEFGEDQLLDEERIQMQLSQLSELCTQIEGHLSLSAQKSDLIQEGVQVAIVGQPNVGKSSLLNRLCKTEFNFILQST
jgi:tRNA modification GTPase